MNAERRYRQVVTAILIVMGFVGLGVVVHAQKIGYVSTDAIRDKYEANKMAEERLKQLVEGWKSELEQMQKDIDELELEMKKTRLIWSDAEKVQKERELDDKRRKREQFARQVFEPGGEHDKQAEALFTAVWEKIYLAIQKVSAAEGYDIVWDKSTQPLVYVNAKYDLTVKVMKQLGIDAEDLEKKQLQVIDQDPRNKKAQEPRSRRSRRRSTSAEETPEANATQDPAANPNNVVTPSPNPNNLPPVAPPDSTKPKTEEDVPR
jgi:Skp family chaperone for outer membrane proteins